VNKKFNNQFATQKLRQETSATNFGGATFNPGLAGEQMATNKAFKKKAKKEVKDVEPKLAAGKAKIYMKDKWGWKDAPSIPNRPSKGGFIYKQLFEELSEFVKENEPVDEVFSKADYEKAKLVLSKLKDTNSKLYNAIIAFASDVYPHDLDKELGADIQAAGLNENYSRFKTETKTRNKPDQFHQAVRAVKKKVQEINRLFEYVSRLKEELSEGQDGLKYKMHTEKALAKIKDMVNELNKNIKKFK
jgi:hypothetical protein